MKQQDEPIGFDPVKKFESVTLHMGGQLTVGELITYLLSVVENYGKGVKISEITSDSKTTLNYLSYFPDQQL